MRLAAVLLAFALVPTAIHAQIEEPRIPLQTKMSELNRFRVEYAENYNKKDGAAVLAAYADSAVVVTAEGAVMKGRDQVKGFLGDPAQFPHMVIESEDMAVYGNTAVDVGMLKMHPAGGGEQASRYMVVLRRSMKGWSILRGILTPVKPAE